MQLMSGRINVDDLADAQEAYHSRGWTDGLPVVPPTADAVAACLEWAMLAPDHLIGIEPVRARAITAEKAAINAVMAGCLPPHFPVVVTALTAMLEPEFGLHGPTASTGGCAVLLIVNGPIRRELAMDATFSVLGGADRSRAVIGRAVRLVLANVLDVRPGGIDRSTLGHPGKLGYCIAEDEEATGWVSLGDQRLGTTIAERAQVSSVTAVASMAPRQIMNEWTTDPAELCETIAAETRANQLNYSIWPGNYVVVVPPQLRTHFDNAGWTKADIAQCVFERARVRRGDWAGVGKGAVVKDRADREYPALEAPQDLLVVAAGGPAGGFAAVIPPWLGTRSRAATVAVGACVDCEIR
ncbi:hypothetical protein [Candidatus Poriferisodalis sp.]|uniref:hypothetical protein n=1 Tax=Candidatus Poriferisodalis sp. TaxID=3101277 RepID=UPI003D09FAEA